MASDGRGDSEGGRRRRRSDGGGGGGGGAGSTPKWALAYSFALELFLARVKVAEEATGVRLVCDEDEATAIYESPDERAAAAHLSIAG